MPAHVTTTTTPATEPGGAWAKLSAAFTEQAEVLTGRDDLTVTCAPGAGKGSPGCFIPPLATVELDGVNLGHAPAGCDPRRPSDRERYPALWGVFLHETAHVRHSGWSPPDGTATARDLAAMLLEEARIEAVHLRRRPSDRRWLRASAGELVLADFTTGPTGVPEVGTTPWEAAHAAGLLLARVDAGVLDADETATLATAIIDVLGPSRLSALAALWHIAQITADDDHTAMLELGRRWCTILAAAPDVPPPPPDVEDSSRPSPLAEAIAAAVTSVTRTDAPPPPVRGHKARKRDEDKASREREKRAADLVFNSTHRGGHRDLGSTRITGTRPPTPAEQAAARRLARVLKYAAHRERVTITATSATPPGRLRMRGALAADAQRAAGATPTAEPFTRTTRCHVPEPPLRLGIACDVSGSMHAFAAPLASAAWILARAAAHVPDAQSATVIFGKHVRPITHPRRTPTQVQEFAASDGIERFREAVDALTAALDLARPGTARLLVIVSDGIFAPDERTGGQERITRLIKSGCAVLWLTRDEDDPAMDGAHRLALSDPADAATAIGHAATRALRAT